MHVEARLRHPPEELVPRGTERGRGTLERVGATALLAPFEVRAQLAVERLEPCARVADPGGEVFQTVRSHCSIFSRCGSPAPGNVNSESSQGGGNRCMPELPVGAPFEDVDSPVPLGDDSRIRRPLTAEIQPGTPASRPGLVL